MNPSTLEISRDSNRDGYGDRVGSHFRSEWQSPAEALIEPATLVERGLSGVDRIQGGTKQPRRAAVVGTNMLGMLATLMLRIREAEVVTVGSMPEPLLSPNRIKGIVGWKHVWMNPALAPIPLMQEAGARYVCASEMSTDDVTRRFGPFDATIVTSAGLSSLPGLTRGLAEDGALVDLTLGNGIIEISRATSTRSFQTKQQATLHRGGDDRTHRERAARSLALADALYPGWLPRLLQSFDVPEGRFSRKDAA